MSRELLHVLYGDEIIATLEYDRNKDAVSLTYDDSWRFGTNGFPMSLSLPLSKKAHPDNAIRTFLQGLLPDNTGVMEAWGKRFQVSPRNPFDLIKHVGEDCAGALQFIRPERLEPILSGQLDSLIPLTELSLAERLEAIISQSAAIPTFIEGRFSLAGAQAKDALHQKEGNWFVPCGRIPTTHILKPELGGIAHHALNEHFCLQLAAAIGLPSAQSTIMAIGGRKVFCVKRFDRVDSKITGNALRIHQEDTCQALGCSPGNKFQNDDGPSAADIVRLLDRFSNDPADDVVRFTMALALNWIIAGTDAHSKNFSLLHARGSALRLAPLYDLASWLPYERDTNSSKVKLAMKIGGTYRLHEIDGVRWRKWADEAGLSGDGVIEMVNLTVHRVIESLPVLRNSMLEAHDDPFVDKLATLITERALKCEAALG
jgi:serine/threonine-protein kinase HipA